MPTRKKGNDDVYLERFERLLIVDLNFHVKTTKRHKLTPESVAANCEEIIKKTALIFFRIILLDFCC